MKAYLRGLSIIYLPTLVATGYFSYEDLKKYKRDSIDLLPSSLDLVQIILVSHIISAMYPISYPLIAYEMARLRYIAPPHKNPTKTT